MHTLVRFASRSLVLLAATLLGACAGRTDPASGRTIAALPVPDSVPEWRALAASPSHALSPSFPRDPWAASPPVSAPAEPNGRPVLLLAGAGLLGGAVGLVGGAHLGGSVAGCEESPCVLATVIGGALGEVAGMSLGVHLANRRRGDWVADLNAALFSGIVGAFALSRILPENDAGNDLLLVSVPLIQLTTTIITERRTARVER